MVPWQGRATLFAPEDVSMMRFCAFLCVFALLLNVSGCGGSIKGEAEMKEYIAALKEQSEAKEAEKKVEAGKKVVEAAKKIEALKLTKEEDEALKKKYQAEVEKYMKAP
jgi:hypothetical protein